MQAAKATTHPSIRLKICEMRSIMTSMKERMITVECRRPDLGTAYATFYLSNSGLKIYYLNVHQGRPRVIDWELLPYSDYPEARLLHDGTGWNVGELQCWLGFAETQGDDNKAAYLDKHLEGQS